MEFNSNSNSDKESKFIIVFNFFKVGFEFRSEYGIGIEVGYVFAFGFSIGFVFRFEIRYEFGKVEFGWSFGNTFGIRI